MATAASRLLGAGLVIAVEGVPKRQDLARHYGADVVLDPGQGDPVEWILELTGGAGVDAAIESLGAQVTFEGCVRATRPGGTISVIGYFGEGEYVKIPRLDWGVGMSDKTDPNWAVPRRQGADDTAPAAHREQADRPDTDDQPYVPL
jgi:isopropanol dehydrogenase (NADP+)